MNTNASASLEDGGERHDQTVQNMYVAERTKLVQYPGRNCWSHPGFSMTGLLRYRNSGF